MHAVTTCACAHVLSEKKGAMAYGPLHRTMEWAMSVENEACASRLCSGTCRKRSQPSLSSAGWIAVDVFLREAWPLGP